MGNNGAGLIIPTMGFLNFLAEKHSLNLEEEMADFTSLEKYEDQMKSVNNKEKIEFYCKYAEDIIGLPRGCIKAKGKKSEFVRARQILMYIAYENGMGSNKFIGYCFGGRDHSTTICARNVVRDMLETKNPLYLSYYNALQHLLNK
jgi:chromosomal replication initiation ATPase DnaA